MSGLEIGIDFGVEVRASGDFSALTPEQTAMIQQRIDEAKAAAEAVLAQSVAAPTTASLAAAVARFVKCEEAFASQLSGDALSARAQAYTALKTRFEQEFPNV